MRVVMLPRIEVSRAMLGDCMLGYVVLCYDMPRSVVLSYVLLCHVAVCYTVLVDDTLCSMLMRALCCVFLFSLCYSVMRCSMQCYLISNHVMLC